MGIDCSNVSFLERHRDGMTMRMYIENAIHTALMKVIMCIYKKTILRTTALSTNNMRSIICLWVKHSADRF